jgi:serine/threonine-protein kinase RsbW
MPNYDLISQGDSTLPMGNLFVQNVILDSSLEGVDQGEALVIETARRMGFDEDALHEIGVSARESLVNAVAHGNRYSAKKKVQLAVDDSAGRLSIEIADEGSGFDADAVPDPLGEDNLLRQSGRGLLMIRAFMDEVSVTRRQPAGTLVRMVKLRQPSA